MSLVLFLISAQIERGKVPASAKRALSSGGNMLTSTDTILMIGTDQRPKGSKEPGANTSDAGSRSDTMMLWRVGGGTSRRLSIPRDTATEIPGHGVDKINAAYAFGGPALTIKTVEQMTGVKINHLIIVNLANFPKFINALGGITIKTPTDLLGDQRRRQERRVHAEPETGHPPPERDSGADATPARARTAATRPRTTSRARSASSRS